MKLSNLDMVMRNERIQNRKNLERFFTACGQKGGRTAALQMTAEERSARAKKAVAVREAKKRARQVAR